MKAIQGLICGALLFAGTTAFAEDAKLHTEHTDEAGTSVSVDHESSDSTGLTGTRKIEAESKKVTDPKGLGNKSVEVASAETTLKKNGDRSDTTKTVDAAGTERNVTDSKETKKHWVGNGETTTSTHTEVTDPKGLNNKKTVETTKETTVDENGVTTKKTKKVDGETVAERTEKH